jgi:hypothetical protein
MTPRVDPHSGHGIPVSVRKGQGGTGSNGETDSTIAAGTKKSPAVRSGASSISVVSVKVTGEA